MVNDKTIQRIKKLLKENDLTYAKASELTGISPRTFNSYMSGDRGIPDYSIKEIANYFNVSIDYLRGDTDIKTNDITIKKIHEYTGLNDDVIQILRDNKNISDTLNKMFYCFPLINNLFTEIDNYLALYQNNYDDDRDLNFEHNGKTYPIYFDDLDIIIFERIKGDLTKIKDLSPMMEEHIARYIEDYKNQLKDFIENKEKYLKDGQFGGKTVLDGFEKQLKNQIEILEHNLTNIKEEKETILSFHELSKKVLW